MSNKKVLVVGAKSAAATVFIAHLSSHEYSIVTAGRTDCDVVYDFAEHTKLPSDIDVVVNFAASYGGDTDKKILEAVDVNSKGLLQLCMAANQSGARRIVNVSSVFANSNKPDTIYALSKKHGDALAHFYCEQNGIELTTVKPSRLYGDTNTFQKNQPFLYKIISDAKHGIDLTIYGSTDPVRNYLHCQDLAEIIERTIQLDIYGQFNCTYPKNTSYVDIYNAALEVFNQKGNVLFDSSQRDIASDEFELDTTLFERINFYPSISIKSGIERMKLNIEGGMP